MNKDINKCIILKINNMEEYIFIFRLDISSENAQPSNEEMEIYLQQWNHWINDLQNSNHLAEGGNHLSRFGKVVKANNEVTDSVFIENSLSVAGYILILANNMDEAVELATTCPILQEKANSVEIRKIGSAG